MLDNDSTRTPLSTLSYGSVALFVVTSAAVGRTSTSLQLWPITDFQLQYRSVSGATQVAADHLRAYNLRTPVSVSRACHTFFTTLHGAVFCFPI